MERLLPDQGSCCPLGGRPWRHTLCDPCVHLRLREVQTVVVRLVTLLAESGAKAHRSFLTKLNTRRETTVLHPPLDSFSADAEQFANLRHCVEVFHGTIPLSRSCRGARTFDRFGRVHKLAQVG